ncbi:SLAM family member 9-like [Triplophysa dalaica]|uniref:SLAM family member 9-like n=1 Tax=Triplophysa dalaica TaxID=1582913 RepID=UPI0024DFA26F|nr:SLAM family member 9-like [Triplophysa dalaica]
MFFCLCLWSMFGVFVCVSVSVTEGDCVTLFVNLTESQMKNGISWKFGAYESVIADIKSGQITVSDNKPDNRFKDKLQLNKHTGDLRLTNTSVTHTGLYQMSNIKTDQQLATFNLTVYARLPLPVISRVSSLSESSNCSVLCSMTNVSHDVSVSWYKGKSLLSSISVSDHITSISLHLECLNDSYTCVVNNPITNQTQHLNTDVCHKCSEPNLPFSRTVPLSCAVVISVMIAAALLIVCIYRKHRQHVHISEQEITYAEPKFRKRQTHKPICAVEDDVVYAAVMTR